MPATPSKTIPPTTTAASFPRQPFVHSQETKSLAHERYVSILPSPHSEKRDRRRHIPSGDPATRSNCAM
jgi:hypothetical protein